jgi:SAM-dependent methyltransferase
MVDKTEFELIHLLRCPQCSGDHFAISVDELTCESCSTTYPIRQGVPIFVPNPNDIKIVPPDHVSNQISDDVINWLKGLDGYSLNIGAGASQTKIPTCIELEYSIFKTTDVVGDSHHLPFKDNTFEAVVAFNVFEHLYDPRQAAAEIFRVLKPGGKLIIRTAFLQPLHEEPFHYYNATKYGVMKWFSGFEIETCHVSGNFNPVFTLAWLSCDLLYWIEHTYGTETRRKFNKTTLSDWSKVWADPAQRKGFLWETMMGLPQQVQERFAAGFELEATKPEQNNGRASLAAFPAPATLNQSTNPLSLTEQPEKMTASAFALQQRIGVLEAQIQAMETSKFWKLRERWFQIKKKLRLH